VLRLDFVQTAWTFELRMGLTYFRRLSEDSYLYRFISFVQHKMANILMVFDEYAFLTTGKHLDK